MNSHHHKKEGTTVTPQSTPAKTPQAATGIFAALSGLLHARGIGARIVGQVPPVFASISGFLLIHYTAQTHITVEVLFHARLTTARGPDIAHLTVTTAQRFALAVLATGSIGGLVLPVTAQAEETKAPGWEITSTTYPTNLGPAVNEVQEISVTQGEFTLGFEGQYAFGLSFGMSDSEIQTTLEGLSTIGAGNVSVSGGPQAGPGKPYIVEFTNRFAGHEVPQLQAFGEAVTASVKTKGAPSGTLEVNVYNIGAEFSHGTITVTDQLPPGIVATEAGDDQTDNYPIGAKGLWSCSGIGTSIVTCTNTALLPSLPLPEDVGINTEPGQGTVAHIGISVKVETGKQETLTNRVTVAGGGASAPASTSAPITVGAGPATSFGFQASDGWFSNADGTLDTQAGSHPYEFTYSFDLNTTFDAKGEDLEPAGGKPRDLTVELPPGFVGNPTAVPQCSRQQFDELECAPSSQVGLETAQALGGTIVASHLYTAVYNLMPPPGVPAEFGFDLDGNQVFLDAGVRSGGDYGITVHVPNLPQKDVMGNRITFWGEPSDPVHDRSRYSNKWQHGACIDGCSSSAEQVPFLTLPTACEGPQTFTESLNAWETAGFGELSYKSRDANGAETGFTGCDHLGFDPSISAAPDTTDADTPAGLTVDVRVPQEGLSTPGAIATSNIKDTTVVLPPGLVINPGQAAGLQACQVGPTEPQPNGELLHPGRDNLPLPGENGEEAKFEGPADCPNASKVGTIEIETPLLKHPLQGDAYVLQSNPPNLQLLLTADGEGVNLKLINHVSLCEAAGEVIDGKTCQAAGQLIGRLSETPELPFTNFSLKFSGGAQAALATPSTCGAYATASDFTPWSTPQVGDVFPSSNFAIDSGPNGTGCPSAQLPFAPSLTAGSTTDQAGGFTNFSLLLQSGDAQQRIEKLSFVAPPGMSGVLASVPLCPEPQAAQGACSSTAQIGHAVVASGPGPYPLTIPQPGDPESPIYLTGPYHGAPFGLSIVTHVLAGPFNLGTIVTRARVEINPYTAQIEVTTDPLPQVVDGVPTDLRLVDSVIDRPGFIFNPTSCNPQSFSGTATGIAPPGNSSAGTTAPISSHFQVGSCQSLKFEPKFSASTSGKTSKANGASLTLKVTRPSGPSSQQANFTEAKIELPEALPSRLTTLQKACLAKVFETNPAACPSESDIGYVKVVTPILPVPLQGPAYFVSHGGEAFPSVIVVLQGDGITIDVVSTTFISKAGITSATIKTVPDQPFTSFELTFPEGKFSALGTNKNLCKPTKTVTVKQKVTVKRHGKKVKVTKNVTKTEPEPLEMPTEFIAQNGLQIHQSTPISVTGCPPVPDRGKLKAAKHAKRNSKGKNAKKKGRR
jgi:hypothetical protein